MSSVVCPLIFSIISPIIQVYKGYTIENHFQFEGFEETQQLFWNNLILENLIQYTIMLKKQTKTALLINLYNNRC